jgi:hypothetical protein
MDIFKALNCKEWRKLLKKARAYNRAVEPVMLMIYVLSGNTVSPDVFYLRDSIL